MVSDYTDGYTNMAMACRGPYPWLLASITGGVILLVATARRRLLRVEVQGQSMAPGLRPGDRLLAVRGLAPRAGDVVMATDPRQPSRVLVKRVVAVGADDRVELAGDNAAASTDSRSFGPVPGALVTGRVLWRYSPSDRRGRFPPRPPRTGTARQRSGRLTQMDRAHVAQVLDTDEVGEPTTLSMEELRSRRSELQGVEVTLSYQRRMAQGRLDIVASERRRRESGGEALEPEGIVAQLSEILAPRTRGAGNGRLSQLLAPEPDQAETPELDAIAGADVLAALPTLADDDLEALVDALAEFESECSVIRRRLHERIDALQAEVVRRYRTGEATVDTLLR